MEAPEQSRAAKMPQGRYKIIHTQSSLLAPPMLDSPASPAEQSVDLFTPLADLQDAPVQLVILNIRVLAMAVGLTLGLGTISSVMIQGINLTKLRATDLSDADKSELLDRYNTYTGALFSAVSMSFQQVVVLIVPVFLLCFATSTVLNEHKSLFQRWAPAAATIAASLLVGQGLNAINVQFDSPRIEFIIDANDLSASNSANYSFIITNITNSASIAGIPSSDTILRDAIRSSSSDEKTACVWTYGWTDSSDSPEASIRYGFPLNSWLQHLLPTSVKSKTTVQFSMSEHSAADSTESFFTVSGWTLDDASKLFSYGLAILSSHYSATYTEPQEVYHTINSSDAVRMVSDMQVAVQSESLFPFGFENISVPEMAFEFSNFELSPQIRFDAVTFKLPVEMEIMQIWVQDPVGMYSIAKDSANNNFTDMFTSFMGNEHAFIVSSPTTLHDQVRIMKLCMKAENDTTDDVESFYGECGFPMQSSVLIYSFAQHIAMDELDILVESDYRKFPEIFDSFSSVKKVRMKNQRKIYSVTVGKLSWQVRNMAQVYGAKCGGPDNCMGLAFPLTGVNQHVVVGETHIPALANAYLAEGFGQWQVLAASRNEAIVKAWNGSLGSRAHVDLLYPPIYPAAVNSLPWSLSDANCSNVGSGFINDIIQRHIYSKDPVQPAYTAGLFWLFSNAAAHDIETPTNGTHQLSIKLDFSGNLMWISPRVSMPRTSAILTIAGCLLILAAGLLINLSSVKRRHEIQRRLCSPHNVGEILFNTVQFPPVLLRTAIQQAEKEDTASIGQCSDLRAYTITDMVFWCQAEGTESVVEIRHTEADEVQIHCTGTRAAHQ